MSSHTTAVLQALFVTFLWSTSWVLIRIGLNGMYELAQREEDALTMLLATAAMAEVGMERAPSDREGRRLSVICAFEKKRRPKLKGVLDREVEVLANRARSGRLPRRARGRETAPQRDEETT